MTFDKPILIQHKDRKTKQWITVQRLHAAVNTTGSNDYTTAGSTRTAQSLNFTVRYNPELQAIMFALQDYRIAFAGSFYKLQSYDDFGMRHKTVKFVGEGHGSGERHGL